MSAQLENTDDIEAIAGIAIFVACAALVGLALAGASMALRLCGRTDERIDKL